ncbi:MAG TPA: hypothetical protein VKY74_02590 [Chloroflexia bacterium]|nr:hypothetical protein [Chloroflexia bacterium]
MQFNQIAPVDVNGQIQLLAISMDGRLYHAVRAPGGWTPLAEVVPANGTPAAGTFFSAAGTGSPDGRLHTVLLAADGAWEAVRAPDGSWGAFTPLPPAVHAGFTVSAVAVAGTLHLLTGTADNRIWYTSRPPAGTWTPAVPIPPQEMDLCQITIVAAAGRLQLFASTGWGGRDVYSATQHAAGWDSPTELVAAADAPSAISHSYTGGSDGQVHVILFGGDRVNGSMITNDDGLWHATQAPDGPWSAFTEVQKRPAADEWAKVSCVGAADGLHVLVATGPGRIWYTSGRPTGPWTPLVEVPQPAELLNRQVAGPHYGPGRVGAGGDPILGK